MANTAAASPFRFYTSAEYWPELIASIEKATKGQRVAVMTMDFDPTQPIIDKLYAALLAACTRGVDVWLLIDARPFLFDPERQRLGTFWRSNKMTHLAKPFQPRLAAIQAINNQSSGHATVINKPSHSFSNPFAGRSHIKHALIDNQIFIGGCNLYNATYIDMMVSWQDQKTADYIFNFTCDVFRYEHVGRALSWMDQVHEIDPSTKLFIDAGRKRQSSIFAQALQLIDLAKESITITCQFFPNTVTAKHLAAAYERGVQVRVIFAHPGGHKGIGGLGQYYGRGLERLRVPAALFKDGLRKDDPMLHAKLLVTDVGSMIGSHNYVRVGVGLGTAEIALLSSDPRFGQDAVAALERELPKR